MENSNLIQVTEEDCLYETDQSRPSSFFFNVFTALKGKDFMFY